MGTQNITYKDLPETMNRCGGHSPNNEGVLLRQSLKKIDKNKNGKIERSETKLSSKKYKEVSQLVTNFKKLLKEKCANGFTLNKVHQARLEILKKAKLKCTDDCKVKE